MEACTDTLCLMERRDLEEQIRAAFAGVRLGAGVSLRQAAAIDVYQRGWTNEQFHRLPEGEVTDDWTSIPDDELARDNIAHLDPIGLRYYLPALNALAARSLRRS
jgi:hypothetical protein